MKIKLDESMPARLARILSQLGGCFVVLTEHKMRVRRPKQR